MSKLSITDVEHIASLSRLSLIDAEKEKFAGQLSNVLSYVDELNEVDTKGVEVTAQVTGLTNIAAKDKKRPGEMSYLEIETNAPEFKDGSFVVPGVFDAN